MSGHIPANWRLYLTGKPFKNPHPTEESYNPEVKRLCMLGVEERAKPTVGPCKKCIEKGKDRTLAVMTSKVMFRRGNAGALRYEVSSDCGLGFGVAQWMHSV